MKILKKKLPALIMVLSFISGISILLYPSISNCINIWFQNKDISLYEDTISSLSFEDYDKLFLEAQKYNKKLVGNTIAKNSELSKNTNYNKLLSLDKSGIMGYLQINKIDVNLPIYHGTAPSTLQNGIGHLEGSSLPADGASTHIVLAGHTGMSSSKLLTDLVEVKIGDVFSIKVLNKKFNYKVDQILVVEPEDTDALNIEKGKQYATLITCTPYGINSHRLLVRGTLYNDKIDNEITNDAVILFK